MKKFLNSALATSVAAIAVATMLAASTASAALSFTTLTLINGWAPYSASTNAPAVALDSKGVVHFKGGMDRPGAGTSVAFVLPASFRPNKLVYVVTNLVNSAPGRLIIHADGTVQVQADGPTSDATSFTSLEGVQFARQ